MTSITVSMVRNKDEQVKGVSNMQEKAYKTMGKTGAFNLVLGICTMVAGIAVGVVMIIHGAKLLGSRKNIMF